MEYHVGSGPHEWNWEDAWKALKAFAWNTLSLSVAVTTFLIAFPQEQLPKWLLPVVASAPFINAFGYFLLQYFSDNRK